MADQVLLLPTTDVIRIPETCRESFIPLGEMDCRPLTEAGVLLAGYSEFGAGYEIGRTAPRFQLMLFTAEGTGNIVFADGEGNARRETAEAGTVFFAPARHAYGYRPAAGPWKAAWFHLDPASAFGGFSIRPCRWADRVAAAVRDLIAECADARHGSRSGVGPLYARILAARIAVAARDDDDRHRLRRTLDPLWNRVSAGLHESWPVKRLAAVAGYSPTHLNRICRSTYGDSAARLLLRLRMERARELLLRTDYPVAVIAGLVGYGDPFAFSTTFRRELGVSPRSYRETFA
jgi:AraC-like DNA-binding protein